MSSYYYGVATRIMMAILSYGTTQISKVDPKFKEIIKNENLVIQWEVKKGGQCSYFNIENGKFHAVRDQKHDKPDIIIAMKDPKIAVNILKGTEEILQKEVEAGNVEVIGDPNKVEQLRPILGIISSYLGGLRD